MKTRLQFIFLLPFLCFSAAFGQNFNYSLTKDSIPYQTITSGNNLASASSWRDKHFGIKLPFQFNFCGFNTDSLTVESNGYVLFAGAMEYAIVSYNNFTANEDTTHNYTSTIKYITEGSNGNRIFKIEFSGLSQNLLSASDYLNYQIWFYENNSKIEIRTGNGAYPIGNDLPALLGLINRAMDSETVAFLATGNYDAPSSQSIPMESELAYLNQIPTAGTVYTFTPTH